MKMAESSAKGPKKLWVKEKLLVMSNLTQWFPCRSQTTNVRLYKLKASADNKFKIGIDEQKFKFRV